MLKIINIEEDAGVVAPGGIKVHYFGLPPGGGVAPRLPRLSLVYSSA